MLPRISRLYSMVAHGFLSGRNLSEPRWYSVHRMAQVTQLVGILSSLLVRTSVTRLRPERRRTHLALSPQSHSGSDSRSRTRRNRRTDSATLPCRRRCSGRRRRPPRSSGTCPRCRAECRGCSGVSRGTRASV